jgi:hypothetical protein
LGAIDQSLSNEVWDEESSRARPMKKLVALARSVPPPEQAKTLALSAPMPFAPQREASVEKKKDADVSTRRAADERAELPPAAMLIPRLDYGNLRLGAPTSADRGRLVPTPREAQPSSDAIDRLQLPPGCSTEWSHAYDYSFAADGKIDVKSDASWHSIAVTARPTSAKIRHVAVPREQADAFRVARLADPFDGPLLPGPIDVYDRGQFVVTSTVEHTAPGGSVDVGLGVDPQVKIARNVEFHEEATGVLRSALRLVHAIAIEIENLSTRAVDLEVRERVPVTREGDDTIEVTLGRVEPTWERWTPDPDAPRRDRLRAGYCWKISLVPSAKKRLCATYEVKLAGRLELVGGNRREP